MYCLATETVKLESTDVAVQCDLLAAPPLEKFAPQQSLDDSFTTEATMTEQDDVDDLDTSFVCSQQGYSTEYACIILLHHACIAMRPLYVYTCTHIGRILKLWI